MKKLLKWGGIALLVIIVIGVISSLGGSDTEQSSNSDTNNRNSQQAEQVQEPMMIEASTLANAFDANQVAAEHEWNGKLVQFSAEISNITDSGVSFYNVATEKEFSTTQISCKIKDKEQLLSLTNGQTVTVRGVVGDQMIGVIDVSDCEIVE